MLYFFFIFIEKSLTTLIEIAGFQQSLNRLIKTMDGVIEILDPIGT